MGRAPGTAGPTGVFRFTAREVAEMEKVLDANKGATPARSTVQHLSDSFSASTERVGQKSIQWKQVWNWFQNRRHSQKAKSARAPENNKAGQVPAGEGVQTKRVTPSSAAVPSVGSGKRGSDAPMEFEAKSARDGAWYDVSTFISHRVASSGDPEVRVRFAGFGPEEDEWVNVRNAVRQRSLPCEASECVAVLPGDLILCFQEGNEQALYYDADILDVQRRRHDVRGCRCRFWVRYRHDNIEEVVPLRKVCRRPETEYRLLKLQSYGKGQGTEDVLEAAVAKPEVSSVDTAGSEGATSLTGCSQPETQGEPPLVASSIPPTTRNEAPGVDSVAGPTTDTTAVTDTADVPVTSVEGTSVVPADDSPAAANSGASVEPDAAESTVDVVVEPSVQDVVYSVPPQREVVEEQKGASDEDQSGQQSQPLANASVPLLQAEPEMMDTQSESIVVLDRVDLEGIRLATETKADENR